MRRPVWNAAVLILLLVPGTTLAAVHKPKRPATVVLHSRFHVVARAGGVLVRFGSEGRYVVFDEVGAAMRLIDDSSRRTTLVSQPPFCPSSAQVDVSPFGVGGGWVYAFVCGGSSNAQAALYSIASKRWTPFPLVTAGGVAVGSRWLEEIDQAPDCVSFGHCSYGYTFTNIATGQVRTLPAWHPGGTTVPDLNSAGLAAPLCSPLRVPQGDPLSDASRDSDAPSPLTFSGPFAVGVDRQLRGGQVPRDELLLERCGTRLHQMLSQDSGIGSQGLQFAINRHAVVWVNSLSGPLHGVFLPSLKQFQIPLGPMPQDAYVRVIALTSRNLYVWNVGGNLLATPAPK